MKVKLKNDPYLRACPYGRLAGNINQANDIKTWTKVLAIILYFVLIIILYIHFEDQKSILFPAVFGAVYSQMMTRSNEPMFRLILIKYLTKGSKK